MINEIFYCYHCLSPFMNQNLIESSSTLIICPESILYQWKDEIELHIKKESLK